MESAITVGLQGLFEGVMNLGPGHAMMLLIGCLLLYLGISKGYEPLLFVPIGFGAILVNIPLAGLMENDGFLRFLYNTGVITELFPALDFCRNRRDDGLPAAYGESKNYSSGRRRPVWNFSHAALALGHRF